MKEGLTYEAAELRMQQAIVVNSIRKAKFLWGAVNQKINTSKLSPYQQQKIFTTLMRKQFFGKDLPGWMTNTTMKAHRFVKDSFRTFKAQKASIAYADKYLHSFMTTKVGFPKGSFDLRWKRVQDYYSVLTDFLIQLADLKEKGVEKVLVLRTRPEPCDLCDPRANRVYDIDKVPPPPHPSCKCIIVAYEEPK